MLNFARFYALRIFQIDLNFQVILDGGGRNCADKAGRTPAVLAEEHAKSNVLNMLQALPVVK